MSKVVKSRENVCYLHVVMNSSTKYLFKNLAFILLLLSISSCTKDNNQEFSDVAKVALRDVGHRILLINQDSTSLVKPIIALESQKYQLSFEEAISIHPDSLVNTIKSSFQKAGLPEHYLTEVRRFEDNEVVYSYQIKQNVEKDIVPCGGRELRKAYYIISVRFTKSLEYQNSNSILVYILLFGTMLIIAIALFKRKHIIFFVNGLFFNFYDR